MTDVIHVHDGGSCRQKRTGTWDLKRRVRELTELRERYDSAQTKIEQLRIEMGKRITTIKQMEKDWLDIVDKQCGIGRTWAYELIKLADGRTSIERQRETTRASVKKSRKNKARPLRSGLPPPAFRDLACIDNGMIVNDPSLPQPEDDQDYANWHAALLTRAKYAIGGAAYEDWSHFNVDSAVIDAAQRAADAWNELAAYLKRLKHEQATQKGAPKDGARVLRLR